MQRDSVFGLWEMGECDVLVFLIGLVVCFFLSFFVFSVSVTLFCIFFFSKIKKKHVNLSRTWVLESQVSAQGVTILRLFHKLASSSWTHTVFKGSMKTWRHSTFFCLDKEKKKNATIIQPNLYILYVSGITQAEVWVILNTFRRVSYLSFVWRSPPPPPVTPLGPSDDVTRVWQVDRALGPPPLTFNRHRKTDIPLNRCFEMCFIKRFIRAFYMRGSPWFISSLAYLSNGCDIDDLCWF